MVVVAFEINLEWFERVTQMNGSNEWLNTPISHSAHCIYRFTDRTARMCALYSIV